MRNWIKCPYCKRVINKIDMYFVEPDKENMLLGCPDCEMEMKVIKTAKSYRVEKWGIVTEKPKENENENTDGDGIVIMDPNEERSKPFENPEDVIVWRPGDKD